MTHSLTEWQGHLLSCQFISWIRKCANICLSRFFFFFTLKVQHSLRPAMLGWHHSEKGNIALKKICISRAAQVMPTCQPGSEKMEREWENEEEMGERKRGNERMGKWRGNGERMRKWRENEIMERDSLSTFPHFLFISSLTINFLY